MDQSGIPGVTVSNLSAEPEYPSLVRRYMVTFIDGATVFLSLFALAYLLPGDHTVGLRAALVMGVFLIYEPVCTSRICTLGQKLMGVRVRRVSDLRRISIPQAYLRITVKVVLGWISFVSIAFSNERRALHDHAIRSVVVRATP